MNPEKYINGRIPADIIAGVFHKAVAEKFLTVDDTSAVFFDLSLIESRIANLQDLTKDIPSLHTSAMKANPVFGIIKKLVAMNAGAEAASLPELYMAIKAGISPDRIVFDSPAKTTDEIKYAIEQGVNINADSLDELERIDGLVETSKPKSTFGLRINPQVGAGEIDITSVAGKYSKFGIPLDSNHELIIDAYTKYHWLTGIHLHIGSQGMPIDKLIEAVSKVFNLAEEINSALEMQGAPNRIITFDIGGGLPATYLESDPKPSLDYYFAKLRDNIPGLFSGNYKLITEFGRHLHANAGWAISRIEYLKEYDDIKFAVIHLGADMFIRECYNRQNWPHEFSVLNGKGELKKGGSAKYQIAGPLCFAGDIVGVDIELPEIAPGDHIIIHDIGAYTLSMWSRYNSRQMPKIIGYYNDGDKFEIFKNRETPEDLYKFWK